MFGSSDKVGVLPQRVEDEDVEILKTSSGGESIAEPVADVAPLEVALTTTTTAEATTIGVAPIGDAPDEVVSTEVATTVTSVPSGIDHMLSFGDCFHILFLTLMILQRHLYWLPQSLRHLMKR